MKGQRGVRVLQVFCPRHRSVAFGQGYDVHTRDEVRFLGDFHLLYNIGLEIVHARLNGGGIEDLPIAEVEEFQVVAVASPPKQLASLDAEVRPKYEPPPTREDLKLLKGGKGSDEDSHPT